LCDEEAEVQELYSQILFHTEKSLQYCRYIRQYGVMEYIVSFYDVLHTFGDQYIVEDIDRIHKGATKKTYRHPFS